MERGTATPAKCTATTASSPGSLSSASASDAALRLSVTGSTSSRTGSSPRWYAAMAVETKVQVGTPMRAPRGRPRWATAISSAAVHDDTATTCSIPTYSASSDSSRAHSSPVVIQPLRSTAAAASTSSSEMSGSENRITSVDTAPAPAPAAVGRSASSSLPQ